MVVAEGVAAGVGEGVAALCPGAKVDLARMRSP